MKLTHLIAAGTAATLSYLAVKNRDKILQEMTETTDLIHRMQDNYQTIQDSLTLIQSYQKPVQEMAEEIQYKVNVYQQSIAGNLNEIQKIKEKYLAE
ncbi:chemotaxis protein [Streptococcus marmotae]|uniref:chemotaxis protein n=1 Tax=Streptococcus marmotae TaxID=1825069 RepID=UPI0008346E06|nr:chemotaxis protein [Streptococcus marmotae]